MPETSEVPRLLSKLAYRELLVKQASPLVVGDEAERVVAYASSIWESLELKPRPLSARDILALEKHGDVLLFELKAYPRKQPNIVVMVAARADFSEFLGHILIDVAADDAMPELTCPSLDFAGAATPDGILELLAQINPDDDDPYAILETGDGTYIQTLNTGEGYILEYQLVNISSHYETPELVSLEAAASAFLSYGFGDHEWLDSFAWQLQDLSEMIEEPPE